MSTERTILIEEAIALGHKSESLSRMPTYMIKNAIHNNGHGKPARSVKKSSRRVNRTEHRRKRLNNVVHDLNVEAEDLPKEDDTVTVVDMSHITTTENPSEQKYQRFTFLVKVKNEMVQSISINTKISQENMDKLDPDDTFVIEQSIASAQENLKSINLEMDELKVWFHEVHKEKKILYERISSTMVDVTGNMMSHFHDKMNNIDKYMQSLILEEERVVE